MRMTLVRLDVPRPACPFIHFCVLVPLSPPDAIMWVHELLCRGLLRVSCMSADMAEQGSREAASVLSDHVLRLQIRHARARAAVDVEHTAFEKVRLL